MRVATAARYRTWSAGRGAAPPAAQQEAARNPGADAKGGKDSKSGGTATTGKAGTNTSDRKPQSDTAEVAAGGTGGGSDGGSPVGVIVALAVVAAAVAGGLRLRRQRRGPAPG